jgi:hypothetical protein
MKHRVDDLGFELPAGWTLSALFTEPSAQKEGFRSNIVMATDRFRPDETFKTYIDRQLVELARGLKKFQLRTRGPCAVRDVEGHRIDCAWQGGSGPIEQTVIMFPREGGVRTFTATAVKAESDGVRAALDHVLASLDGV